MQNLIKLEEIFQSVLAFLAFLYFGGAWYVFLLLLIAPDISMLGYLVNSRVGAYTYNFAHHKAVAIAFIILGFSFNQMLLTHIGLLLFAHSSMDRALGLGLKYTDEFSNTHLGRLKVKYKLKFA